MYHYCDNICRFPQKTSDGIYIYSSNVYETVLDPVYSNSTKKGHSASNQQDTPASSTAVDDLEYHYTMHALQCQEEQSQRLV